MILQSKKKDFNAMTKAELIAVLVQIESQSTIMEIKRDAYGDYVHPTQKPVELPAAAIINTSAEGDLLYEPFGGSGSTMSACEQLGRNCSIMEKDPKYCDVIVERYAGLVGANADNIFKTGIHEAE